MKIIALSLLPIAVTIVTIQLLTAKYLLLTGKIDNKIRELEQKQKVT